MIRARLLLPALAGLVLAVGGIVALDRALPPPLHRGEAVSVVVADRAGRPLRAFPVEDGRWRLAADASRLDPAFIAALIAIEDRRFFSHHGVDPLAVFRAGFDFARTGRITSGASTITMQTARLLEPRPRHLGSKLIEALRAVQLEARLSKDEILELYLTLTPYGGNLEGVRSASLAWFGHDPASLTPDEIALLIALPQAPESRRPDLRPQNAVAARARILARMSAEGLISAERAAEAAAEPAPSRNAFPAHAWHAAEHVRRRADGPEIVSSLDARLQARAEALAEDLARRAGPHVQASVIVVEIESRAVRALAGSAGRDRPGGWLDLTDRPRSPGSTLKPLIYALAFEDGIATGTTRIDDLPSQFAGYRPENFDRMFRGQVTVAEALQHSLNVPAVRLLDAVGANRFEAALRFAGSNPRAPARADGEAGLALALGGMGVTAREIAALFAALGDEGRARPLAFTEDEAAANGRGPGHALVSAGAAGDVLDILRRSPAPPGRMPARLTEAAPDIAYKTGTSYGFRDAWAAGVANGYVAVVWTGRPDGAPRPGVTGREAALPALYDVFDAIAATDPAFSRRARPYPVIASGPDGAMNRVGAAAPPPEILFPPDGAEVWSDDPRHAFVLAARGTGRLAWYEAGAPLPTDAAGQPLWTPDGPGFHTLTVVDGQGRAARTRVRVRTPSG